MRFFVRTAAQVFHVGAHRAPTAGATRRARLLVPAAMVALWWGGSVLEAQAQQETLVIEGQVVNATALAEGPLDVQVVVHQNRAGARDDLTTTTDPDGRFRFEGIVYDSEVLYGVSVIYQGALYGRDLDLSGGPPGHITLTVYESSDSDDVLSVASSSLLIAQVDKAAQLIWALEIARVVNGTDRTYVPGPEPMKLLRFGLPPGAVGLQVDTALLGVDVIQVDRGFALTGSVPPGDHEVMYAYRFPYERSETTITKSYPYGAGEVRMMAPEGLVDFSSEELGEGEAVTVGGRSYRLLPGSGLPRGSEVSFTLGGLPRASFAERLSQRLDGARLELVVPAGLGLLLLLVIAFALWKRGTLRQPDLASESGTSAVEGRRSGLIRQIADLEQSLEQGRISESQLRQRRGVLVKRLAALTRSQPDAE